MQQIELKHLGRLIANCWSRAEEEVKFLIAEKYHGPAEEDVTFLLAGELRKELVTASRDGKVARAFLNDLQSICGVRPEDVRNFNGVMARVVFHRRTHESRRSASDLGAIINQPRLRFRSPSEVVVERDCRRGLLAQAKLFRAEEDQRRKQSRLTKAQEHLIPVRMSYYALLAYRVERQSGNLDSLAWQVCRKEHTLKDVKAWLREHTFLNEERTYDVIRRLAAGRIGTDNPAVVNEIVDEASTTRVIEVHLHWPDDRRPPRRSSTFAGPMWYKRLFSLCGDEMFHQAQPGGGVIVRPNTRCRGRGPQRGAAELSPCKRSRSINHLKTICGDDDFHKMAKICYPMTM